VTKIGEHRSTPKNVDIGLPQGTKLSNLLFILYINDIELILNDGELSMFADDTLISIADETENQSIKRMNELMINLSDWLKFNRIALNVKKSNAMIINNKTPLNVKNKNDAVLSSEEKSPLNVKNENAVMRNMVIIDNEKIDYVGKVKYLGVVLDSKLTFRQHLE
jgi:hypothetical protein